MIRKLVGFLEKFVFVVGGINREVVGLLREVVVRLSLFVVLFS